MMNYHNGSSYFKPSNTNMFYGKAIPFTKPEIPFCNENQILNNSLQNNTTVSGQREDAQVEQFSPQAANREACYDGLARSESSMTEMCEEEIQMNFHNLPNLQNHNVLSHIVPCFPMNKNNCQEKSLESASDVLGFNKVRDLTPSRVPEGRKKNTSLLVKRNLVLKELDFVDSNQLDEENPRKKLKLRQHFLDTFEEYKKPIIMENVALWQKYQSKASFTGSTHSQSGAAEIINNKKVKLVTHSTTLPSKVEDKQEKLYGRAAHMLFKLAKNKGNKSDKLEKGQGSSKNDEGMSSSKFRRMRNSPKTQVPLFESTKYTPEISKNRSTSRNSIGNTEQKGKNKFLLDMCRRKGKTPDRLTEKGKTPDRLTEKGKTPDKHSRKGKSVKLERESTPKKKWLTQNIMSEYNKKTFESDFGQHENIMNQILKEKKEFYSKNETLKRPVYRHPNREIRIMDYMFPLNTSFQNASDYKKLVFNGHSFQYHKNITSVSANEEKDTYTFHLEDKPNFEGRIDCFINDTKLLIEWLNGVKDPKQETHSMSKILPKWFCSFIPLTKSETSIIRNPTNKDRVYLKRLNPETKALIKTLPCLKRVHTQDFVEYIDKVVSITINRKWADVMNLAENLDTESFLETKHLTKWIKGQGFHTNNWIGVYNNIMSNNPANDAIFDKGSNIEVPVLISSNCQDHQGKKLKNSYLLSWNEEYLHNKQKHTRNYLVLCDSLDFQKSTCSIQN